MILFSVHSILFRVSLVAWLVKNLPVMRDTWVRSLGWEDHLEEGSIPGLGRSPGGGKGYPLQYSGLEKSIGHKKSDTTERL